MISKSVIIDFIFFLLFIITFVIIIILVVVLVDAGIRLLVFVFWFVSLFVFMPLVYFSSAEEATDLNFVFVCFTVALFSLNIQRWTIIIGLRDCT